MIRAILFDIDDTIYEFLPVHKKALEHVYGKYCKHDHITLAQFEAEFQKSWDEVKVALHGTAASGNRAIIFQNLVERRFKKFDSDLITELYTEYWISFLENIVLFDGVLDLFAFLRKNNIKIGFITDLTTSVQMKKISELGISTYVDAFVSSEECGENKPSPKIFRCLLRKLGVSSDEVLMVGDTAIKDIVGAKKLGIKTIQLLGGAFAKKMSGEAESDHYANEFSEIKELIAGMLNSG